MTIRVAAVGFSTRALVAACVRAGFHPFSLDAFADYDCRRDSDSAIAVPWRKGKDSVDSIVGLLQAFGQRRCDCPLVILLGGGAENWPELVEELHNNFPSTGTSTLNSTEPSSSAAPNSRVLGPTASQLRLLRDPNTWELAADSGGIVFPPTLPCTSSPDGDRQNFRQTEPPSLAEYEVWLQKPYAGAGGVAISRVEKLQAKSAVDCYLQKRIDGRVLGAHLVCSPQPRLLGFTESFDDKDWWGPSEFVYRGSWGPLLPRDFDGYHQLESQIVAVAEYIQSRCGIIGWLQFDLILDARQRLWLIDVNPRWSAGMEVLVDSCACNPVVEHLKAYGYARSIHDRLWPTSRGISDDSLDVRCAKAVVYTREEVVLSAAMVKRWQALSHLADVPNDEMIGQTVEAGSPLLSVKAAVPASVHTEDAKRVLLSRLNAHRRSLFD